MLILVQIAAASKTLGGSKRSIGLGIEIAVLPAAGAESMPLAGSPGGPRSLRVIHPIKQVAGMIARHQFVEFQMFGAQACQCWAVWENEAIR
jgi:hypothetical protein